MKTANITWKISETGEHTPISDDFDDIYFSIDDGLAETRYVFLDGNNLPKRFSDLSDYQNFTIIETGFGTGLNFLATCLLWANLAPKNATLHFISTEKYPLNAQDFAHALSLIGQKNSELSDFSKPLIAQYPLTMTGLHRLHFGNITLDLYFGDATRSLAQSQAVADAWFLDGFAPSKNNDMWSDELFGQIKRLSHQDTTLATFTAAGFVKRHLIDIGANPKKIKGFGKKREMLTATFENFAKKTTHSLPKSITVIGAGVAGLCLAYKLAERGIFVNLIDQVAPISGASGNPRALFAPKLSQKITAHEHLPTISFLYAKRFYQQLNQTSDLPIFEQTGVVDFLEPTNKSFEKLKNLVDDYPDELISLLNDNDKQQYAEQQSDFDRHTISTWLANAGLINTKLLASHILAHPNITYHQQTFSPNDLNICHEPIVICTGYELQTFFPQLFCRKIRGQVTYTPLTQTNAITPIKYDGYCATFIDDDTPYFLMGASFVRNDTDSDVRDDEHDFNLEKFRQALPNLNNAIRPNLDTLMGRASIRAQTPDYHPIIGKMKDNIYVFAGLGSKGFSFAPLCAEILLSMLTGTPLPVNEVVLNKISPHRQRIQAEHQQ